MDRDAARRALLAAAGWGGARSTPLAGDASARRYARLTGGPGGVSAVLMDAPPGAVNDTRRFTAMTRHLQSLGFSAPEVLAADHETGFLLLEDLGDDLVARVVADRPELEPGVYQRAADLLAALTAAPAPEALEADGALIHIPAYDAEFLSFEAGLFVDWWWPQAGGGPPSPDLSAEFDALVADACAPVAGARDALVLRDYHAENLIWLADRPGLAAVGLLDYQDARRGHAAYDLVSLLEDARRDVSLETSATTRARYAQMMGLSVAARTEFDAACAILGAQRNLKIVGIFARLWLRDGKSGYLPLIPRVWRHLQHDLAHPALAPLRDFLAAHAPIPSEQTLARVRAAGAGAT